ncbi:unnamed protein product [Rhodiola kirilowii]
MGLEIYQAQNPSVDTPENVESLLEAARYDDIEDIVSLSSLGVPLDSKDSQGRTALHMAAANGHLQIVEYLICNGVDVNASNIEDNTPLHWACLNGHMEVVKKFALYNCLDLWQYLLTPNKVIPIFSQLQPARQLPPPQLVLNTSTTYLDQSPPF